MKAWFRRLLSGRRAAPAGGGETPTEESGMPSGAAAPPGYEPASVSGFDAYVGPVLRMAGAGETADSFLFDVREHHLNGAGYLHGGMLMALAEIVLGAAARRAANAPCTVVSLNCDFVAAGRPGDRVEGEARITRRTRSVVFLSGELHVREHNGACRTLLTATGIWKIAESGEGA